MDNSIIASETQFRICPLCEESRLVFSGLNEARCPVCKHEPDEDFLKTLRQIVALPGVSELPHSHPSGNPEPENRTWGRG